jgi:hypothetical protein
MHQDDLGFGPCSGEVPSNHVTPRRRLNYSTPDRHDDEVDALFVDQCGLDLHLRTSFKALSYSRSSIRS